MWFMCADCVRRPTQLENEIEERSSPSPFASASFIGRNAFVRIDYYMYSYSVSDLSLVILLKERDFSAPNP